MNRTKKNLTRLYSDITAYAAAKLKRYGLPRHDLGDIITEAYLKAQEKLPRHVPRKDRETLIKNIAWSGVMDELKRRKKIAALHDQHDLRLDAPPPGQDADDEDAETGDFAISDGCKGADAIRYGPDPGETTPKWLVAFRKRYADERGKPKKILVQLKKTWNFEKIRSILELKEDDFDKILKNLKMRFDPIFRAYHEWLAEISQRFD